MYRHMPRSGRDHAIFVQAFWCLSGIASLGQPRFHWDRVVLVRGVSTEENSVRRFDYGIYDLVNSMHWVLRFDGTHIDGDKVGDDS